MLQEKGLVTYFEETWIAEKEQRRHSIEREIEIQESELYNKNKPPPLFYGKSTFHVTTWTHRDSLSRGVPSLSRKHFCEDKRFVSYIFFITAFLCLTLSNGRILCNLLKPYLVIILYNYVEISTTKHALYY